ncbi:MAG: DEAD/DEAH box helicase [Candidatus Goldbacteria bacterium]|nr:DEAD/DEAH box helicase [Candidatus Goldiibacteriota bacterium]
MKNIETLLNKLKKENFYKNQIKEIIKIPDKKPEFDTNINFSKNTLKYLKGLKIENLYIHQAEAIKYIRDGKNTVITTPTASGKTLIFNIAILEELEKNFGVKGLFIYPAKALANDQLNGLNQMKKLSGIEFTAGIYDGDTPSDKKKYLRENADIILTNPYELHQILSYHSKWKKFFKNLKYVVLDEAHRYRGIFGSNVAFVLRRLKRILKYYNSNPLFILSTASLANPLEFAEKLTGEKFICVENSGSPSGIKYLCLWDASQLPEKSVHTQTKDILLYTTKNSFQTLAFTTSRRLAELIRMWANKEEKNIEILSYRAGYEPSIRREIEKKLKEGIIKGLVSTNALELGIDIGQLDVIIISGYPGTISSFWQQAGRAGRKMQPSLIFFLPYEDAMQKYLIKNPEILLNKKFENAIISLENKNILSGHLLCSISELPAIDKNIFSDIDTSEILNIVIDKGLVKKTSHGFIYTGSERPQNIVSLDNAGGKNIKIKIDGKLLEEISITRAYREAHSGSIYLYNGETYFIKELDLNEGIAHAEKKDVDYFTEPLKNEEVKITNIIKSKKFKSFELFFGNVSVTEYYKGFKAKKYGEVIFYEDLQMPPLHFNTQSVWVKLDDEIKENIEKLKLDFDGALHAAEHALIALSPLFAMCDPNDLGGLSYPVYEDGSPFIFLYDAYEGGIGLSEKLYDIFYNLLSETIEMVKKCECESGCPSCVYAHNCGNNNNPIDKAGAVVLMEKMK